MQKGTGQDVKPNLISKVRKNIARVKTIINQKSAGAK
jgi:ribosomal protein L29